MKRLLYTLSTLLFFLLLLLFPQTVFRGAESGLLLWFRTVLPTLLPFLIVSNFLIRTDAARMLARLLTPILGRLFRVSPYGSFAMLTGFLCGYPMGGKVTADLLREGRISLSEASYLLSFCNNTSPGFIVSFLVWQCLKAPSLAAPTLLLLLGVPMFFSMVFRRFLHVPHPALPEKMADPPSITGNEGLADGCIMDAIENITRIGGYILLFSILFSLAEQIPGLPLSARLFLLPSLEMTTGVRYICSLELPFLVRYASAAFLTSFGGFCCLAQTASILKGTPLKIMPYFAEKLVTAAATSFLSCLFLLIF